MKTRLTIDIGNSMVTWGRWRGSELVARGHGPHAAYLSATDRASAWGSPEGIEAVGVATVESSLAATIAEGDAACLPAPHWFRGAADLPVEISPEVTSHDTIGVDRLLNVLGWCGRGGACPAVLVDFGTAITIDVVDGPGRFAGGLILPGERLLSRALSGGTAFLPEIEPESSPDAPAIGTETRSAIGRGLGGLIVGGVAHHLDRIVRSLGAEMRVPVIATGGGGARWAGAIPAIDRVVPDLTLRGIREALERAGS